MDISHVTLHTTCIRVHTHPYIHTLSKSSISTVQTTSEGINCTKHPKRPQFGPISPRCPHPISPISPLSTFHCRFSAPFSFHPQNPFCSRGNRSLLTFLTSHSHSQHFPTPSNYFHPILSSSGFPKAIPGPFQPLFPTPNRFHSTFPHRFGALFSPFPTT